MRLFLFIFLVVCGPACTRQVETTAMIHTDLGDMTVRLFDHTPKHRDNFIRLAESGFYDSLLFHRVVLDLMIQGGDPDSKGAAAGQVLGHGGPGHTIAPEIRSPHLRGALAAARLPDFINPDKRSNGSQFFIVQGLPQDKATLDALEQKNSMKISPAWRKLYYEKGGAPELDGQYTVFGEVVDGLEVIDRIAAVPRDPNDRPLEDIRMRIEILRR